MSVKDRMKEFLAYIDMSQGKFEKFVGLSNGYINNLGDSIREDSKLKISSRYPELNITWLITGEGVMLKGVPSPFDPEDPINIERAKIIALQKKVAMLESMVYQLSGKEKSYEDSLDDIDRSTIVELADLRRSGKKG